MLQSLARQRECRERESERERVTESDWGSVESGSCLVAGNLPISTREKGAPFLITPSPPFCGSVRPVGTLAWHPAHLLRRSREIPNVLSHGFKVRQQKHGLSHGNIYVCPKAFLSTQYPKGRGEKHTNIIRTNQERVMTYRYKQIDPVD